MASLVSWDSLATLASQDSRLWRSLGPRPVGRGIGFKLKARGAAERPRLLRVSDSESCAAPGRAPRPARASGASF